LILSLFCISFLILTIKRNNYTDQTESNYINEKIKLSDTHYDVLIDDLPGSLNNWSWAETQPWFGGGNGSINNPYIIDGHVFEYNIGAGYCFRITNSRKYFQITKCIFRNSAVSGYGLSFLNVTNGKIIDNEFYNTYYGLNMYNTNNTLVYGNNFTNNTLYGLKLDETNFIQILENNISGNVNTGIRVDQSSFVNISNNVVQDNKNGHGINLYGTNMNHTISRNDIKNNGKDSGVNLAYGIYLYGEIVYTNITNNKIINNDDAGIYLWHADKNILKGNLIEKNLKHGLMLRSDSDNNKIFENYFKKNGKHAEDNGILNTWNSSTIGNYWDNYIGFDLDCDGIGDDPHKIYGTANSQDIYPICYKHRVYPIFIDGDASGIGAHNWTWAVSQPWCSGQGTETDPYILANLIINGTGSNSPIHIQNSDVFFIIENCILFNSTINIDYGGIYLVHCENAKIYNNTLSETFAGIHLKFSSNNTISGNDCSSNPRYGIRLEFSSNNSFLENNCSSNDNVGIHLKNSNNYNRFLRNNCSLNGLYGVELDTSSNNTFFQNDCLVNERNGIHALSSSNYNIFSNNNCSSNKRYGIRLESSSNNTFLENDCSSNDWVGIHLKNSNNYNKFSRNNCSLNGIYGIELDSSSNNTFLENDCLSNDNHGIYAYSSSNYNIFSNNNCSSNKQNGIRLVLANNNTIKDNLIRDNIFDGILMEGSSTENIITNNKIQNNQRYGIYLDNTNSQDNNFYLNEFIDNNIHSYDNGSNNYWDNGSIGNYWDNYTDYDLNGDGIGESPYNISGTALSQDNYPIWPIKSPIFINGSATGVGAHNWSWAVNQLWCSGSGKENDPYIIEDYIIDVNRTLGISSIEIVNSIAYFEIKNCKLYGSTGALDDAGVKLTNVQNGLLFNNSIGIDDFNWNGIYLNNSQNIIISENYIRDSGYGIRMIRGCLNINITMNYIIETWLNAIHFQSNCDQNILINNYITDADEGIHLEEKCDQNRLINNTITDISDYGVYISTNCNNTEISSNLLTEIGYHNGLEKPAINIENYCYNNSITKNKIRYNHLDGISIQQNCDMNYINENIIENNPENGIIIDSCGDNYLINNQICNNVYRGINLINCPNSHMIKNNVSNNPNYGLYIQSSNYCEITENLINNNNPGYSLRLSNSNNANISRNEIRNNYYGLYLSSCPNSIIENNIIKNNIEYGINLNSDNCLITENYLLSNKFYGIMISNSDSSNITKNILENNPNRGIVLWSAQYTLVSENMIKNSSQGIYFMGYADNNDIIGNYIQDCKYYGIQIMNDCDYNLLYKNYLVDNTANGYDEGISNYWNCSTIGNYWSDYTGVDLNSDGIGDSPYDIVGTSGSKDYLPRYNNIPYIFIDEYSIYDWKWACEHYWCSGLGTYDNPYIIENKIIDLSWSSNRIEIRNSDVYFIIKNCTLVNSGTGYSGFLFYNTKNGKIVDCTIESNEYGAKLENCNDVNISKNIFSNNIKGISLSSTDSSYIIENVVNQNGIGLELLESNYNFIKQNILHNNEVCILEIDCIGNIFEDNDCGPITFEQLQISIYDSLFSSQGFNIFFLVTNTTLDPIDTATLQVWWDGNDVSNDTQYVGLGRYLVSLEPIRVEEGEDPIELSLLVSAPGYANTSFKTFISVRPSELIDLLFFEIQDQIFTEDHFNLTFYIYNTTGDSIDFASIEIIWDGTDVSADVQNLGNGLYFISLEPKLVSPGDDPIILDINIEATGYQDLNYQMEIAVDPESVSKVITDGGGGLPILIPIIIGVSIGGGVSAVGVYLFLRKRKLGKGIVEEEVVNP